MKYCLEMLPLMDLLLDEQGDQANVMTAFSFLLQWLHVCLVSRHMTLLGPVQTHVQNLAVSELLRSLAGATHHSSCLHKWAQCTTAELQ